MTAIEPVFELVGCAPQPALPTRPLLGEAAASELSDVFKVLASGTRLRIVHALVREGELHVSELAEAVGMTPQAVSNQLRRLTDRRIVAWRRDGPHVRYRVVDPCVVSLLDLGLCLTTMTPVDGDTRDG